MLQLCAAARERRGEDARCAALIMRKASWAALAEGGRRRAGLPACGVLCPGGRARAAHALCLLHTGVLEPSCCSRAAPNRPPQSACASAAQGEEDALFVDPAVYSRNRAFRLYLSSKSGKAVRTRQGSGCACALRERVRACALRKRKHLRVRLRPACGRSSQHMPPCPACSIYARPCCSRPRIAALLAWATPAAHGMPALPSPPPNPP